jgi:hypothetical protein
MSLRLSLKSQLSRTPPLKFDEIPLHRPKPWQRSPPRQLWDYTLCDVYKHRGLEGGMHLRCDVVRRHPSWVWERLMTFGCLQALLHATTSAEYP